MAKEKKKWWGVLGLLIFIIYIFAAARPIPEETVLVPRWITSLESDYPVNLGEFSAAENAGDRLLPFILGDRYGYVRDDGRFAINRIRRGHISISAENWAEYESVPESISVMNPENDPVMSIEDPGGFPLFLDRRVFMVGKEQNSISAIGSGGEKIWTYDFPAPVTCVDAAQGSLLAGTLDGAVVLLNSRGIPVFTPFEPGGSRLSVILGCAISRDATRIAVISGIDNQRFLLLEYFGDAYRVIYHEFLNGGFRRPVHISFVDGDSKIAYEREEGLGIYDIATRGSISLTLDGEIAALDKSDGDRFLFVVTSQGPMQKRFIAIRYPGTIVINAPFRSNAAFLARRDSMIYLGGDSTMASFRLEKK